MSYGRVIQSIFRLSLVVAGLFISIGCAKSAHQTGQDVLDKLIPPELMAEVDQSVSFRELHSSPDSYVGRTVVFGGTAIKSQRVKDSTEIEILQLPIVARMPSDQRSQSEGRFIAVQLGKFLDPAVIERDSPLTVVGEVKGTVTKPLDESEYRYPVLEIKHLVNWKEFHNRDRGGGYASGYGYRGYGYPGYWPYSYGPYGYGGYYGSPFWGPYGYGRGFYPYSYGGGSSPAPPPPPPSSVPPQFRRR